MLNPRKVKYRKQQKGTVKGVSKGATSVDFGQYGLKSMENRWITARQLEAARRAMTRFVQRSGKIWIRVFPDKAITKKGAEVPMGKGKGAVDHYVVSMRRGRIIFEIDGIEEAVAREALRLAGHKLPVRTTFVKRHQ